MVKAIGWLTAAAVLAWAGSATAQHAGSAAKNGSSAVAAKSAPKASANAQPRARPAKQRTAARPARPSEGQIAGLHRVDDPLDLRSSVALVVDQDTDEVLFEKNPHAVLPIASITKLMTALVTLDAGLDLDEVLVVARADRTVDRVHSRLVPGVRLTRGQAMHLALMSSENHAAQLLGRTYPGGIPAFVEAMNAKAQLLGMQESHFADPTGLSADNRSSPSDLVRLVKAAYEYDEIRQFSVSTELALPVGKRVVRYGSTNRLVANPEWEIGLQKTGFISAAGRCLVMQAVVEGQRVVMVLLDSVGKHSRLGDAQRLRDWLAMRARQSSETPAAPPVAAASAGQSL
ncbi:MAG: serine hydrolase [Burkholderiales bacterium]|nr:serine hydrolase [Burkholderiales bacterium]